VGASRTSTPCYDYLQKRLQQIYTTGFMLSKF
jgi:hypothetical protein